VRLLARIFLEGADLSIVFWITSDGFLPRITHPQRVSFFWSHLFALLMYPAEDILNVRLQTLGVVEHTFNIALGGGHYNWIMYDVGGAVRRSMLLLAFTSSLVLHHSTEGAGESSISPFSRIFLVDIGCLIEARLGPIL
jgi:hypothetical protein